MVIEWGSFMISLGGVALKRLTIGRGRNFIKLDFFP
jgi:hypothetical protein